MPTRDEYEADLFRRYESRIVVLELRQAEVVKWVETYAPIVDALRDKDVVADAIAKRIRETRTTTVTKLHVLIAVCALFVPPIVTSVLVYVLTHVAR